jgi:hypothetical protein
MRTLLAILLLVACTRPPANPCRSSTECAGFDGKRVTVVGVYRALPHPKAAVRGETQPVLARVELDADGEGPYLEPFWSPAAARDAAELARLDGQRVRVTGVYYKVQPRNPGDPPYAAAMGGPCIADIEELAPAP